MANIPALVTVNGTALPEPSSYEATTSTIVDSGRNTQGKVVGRRATRCCKSIAVVELPDRSPVGNRP